MNKRVANARGDHGASKNRGLTRRRLNQDMAKALAERANQEEIAREARIAAARKKAEKLESKPPVKHNAPGFFARVFNRGARGQ
jgi:hypothetical protein